MQHLDQTLPAVQVYKHSDMHHLEQLLQRCPPSKRMLVITDSLFSMDGDFADLPGLVALRRRYGFLLAIDEAHATLVAGDRSASGCCSALLTCWSMQPGFPAVH